MCDLATRERRFDLCWGVVNSGNALCAGIFRTKRDAELYRRQHATAYTVVEVAVVPLYGRDKDKWVEDLEHKLLEIEV
jgi:hypothetical protein